MYTEEQLRQVNATSRVRVGRNIPLVYQAAVKYFSGGKERKIMDFGAGKGAPWTKYLREQGFVNVTPYDIGANAEWAKYEDIKLDSLYDVVLCSNVLNVQPTVDHLVLTFYNLKHLIRSGKYANGGTVLFNWPKSPRKIDFDDYLIEEMAREFFSAVSELPDFKNVYVGVR